MPKSAYDAVVVGSGPNGLAAAITLRQAGLTVLLIEGSEQIGGGMRSRELTLPGFVHDVCSAVHPMARISPFFSSLPLQQHGLAYADPEIAAAHPLDDGSAAVLRHSLKDTADGLGTDRQPYLDLMEQLVKDIPKLLPELLSAFPVPRHPIALGRFGLQAITTASHLSGRFKTMQARGLWGGMAAHSMQPLDHLLTSGIGLMLMGAAHLANWPVVKGGSQSLANALLSYYGSIGGEVQTGFCVKDLEELPTSKVVLMDVTPSQLLKIAGKNLSGRYTKRLRKYRYGMGVFKVDWALKEPVPFSNPDCRRAGTVHIGGSFEEIADSEKKIANGKAAERPFVLFSQPSLFDTSRAPEGLHTAWAYCHVPSGLSQDQTRVIENQMERFAPGFRETILARHTMNASEMEAYNPNYVGGDINGGVQDIWQHFSRPVLSTSPYRTSAKGLYLCSSSTPPGGGVHGMCGYHAAIRALKDIF
ncbi:hypothetical protein DYBT9275_05784 [Dyadobacter sp. CECT 9275]|uniref:FAD-dependent oxidoreductase n=1 Tax=Dyadobacter helix TaxID=2822344 RepID=A0A916JHQ3_9BACT|nr:NAD(P)/FAD-dependent oxidoreductase [Dyadobacter sp. CECT 9275]CAG5017495.1 hypothetical protein DYBT9275_05784 [Dyadobacter sp. CECT 9275]